MSKEMVLFDIDGTLVDKEKRIPASAKQAITDLKKRGIEVAVATGRPAFLFDDICNELGIDSYVCFSGQYVVYKGEVIYENEIIEDEVLRLHEKAEAAGYPMIFMTAEEMKATVAEHPHVFEGLQRLRFDYPETDPKFHIGNKIFQALLFCDESSEEGMRCIEDRSRFIRWHQFACDVLPGGGSKAVGIGKLLDAAGISQRNTYAFGDGPNDVEMLQFAGVGIAMENAVAELKKAADHITDHVEQDGVAKGLRHFGLI
ncbi:Cof-type HAD-IIB family hydrolase [Aciduricibacillus chroicocephali]|uniref:Cof-type HAD-IIB family hydrolase n=1 Tax=Aciduricibacillus chroicocephali TaxID=3054939 RepID=A0ABY9KXR2_9BACI|nr:Cof-type HAD-IIB family hydrolase [Bacillaceae bacterium 44XB]